MKDDRDQVIDALNGAIEENKRLVRLLRMARNEIMDKIIVENRNCVLYDAINDAIGDLATDD